MPRLSRSLRLQPFIATCVTLLGLMGCSSSQPVRPVAPPTQPPIQLDNVPANNAEKTAALPQPYPVMLGIDVLEAEGFAAVKGKRIGLLTHQAGVNRRGESTIDVLRRAPGVKLVALYAPEHGLYGTEAREVVIPDRVDKRTGLPVHSWYGKVRRPTKEMLKGLDAMVVDLQDIGSRSYTYISAMRLTMEACFENGVEVIVLDRPNPLGGLKVDGPPLDMQWSSWNVGAFRVPYVHGLTIGELAKMAKEAPAVLDVSDAVRQRGKLTVIAMRGWTRAMRWPETGLKWVPTSGGIPTWEAVQGYPMVGLGTFWDPPRIDIGFRHGIGNSYPFRGLSHKTVKDAVLEKELQALKLPGLRFQRVSALDKEGKPATGIFIEITDYDEWRPTELNFYLMKLACKFDPKNPFAPGPGREFKGFLRHMGSTAFLDALQRDGAKIDVEAFLRDWAAKAKVYQQQSRKYWLYY